MGTGNEYAQHSLHDTCLRSVEDSNDLAERVHEEKKNGKKK